MFQNSLLESAPSLHSKYGWSWVNHVWIVFFQQPSVRFNGLGIHFFWSNCVYDGHHSVVSPFCPRHCNRRALSQLQTSQIILNGLLDGWVHRNWVFLFPFAAVKLARTIYSIGLVVINSTGQSQLHNICICISYNGIIFPLWEIWDHNKN